MILSILNILLHISVAKVWPKCGQSVAMDLKERARHKFSQTCAAEDVGMVFLRGSASPRRGGAHRPKPPHRPPNWVTTHALSRTRLPPLPTPRPSEGRTYAHWSA